MTVQELLGKITAAISSGTVTGESTVQIEINTGAGSVELHSPSDANGWLNPDAPPGIFLISADAAEPAADTAG